MRLIFVSNNWGDPHQQVRLKSLEHWALTTVTFAFTRLDLPGSTQKPPFWKYRVTHGRYLKRTFAYLSFCRSFSRKLDSSDMIYVFGFDLLVLVFFIRFLYRIKPRIIYELPDIRELLFRQTCLGRIARLLEAHVVPRLHLLVVSSGDYVSGYLIRIRGIAVGKYLVMENKLHAEIPCIGNSPVSDRIRIGYPGILRCNYTLECLLQLAEIGNFTIHIYGVFMPSTQHLVSRIQKQKNIEYHGPYQYPSDLIEMYKNIDVLWAGYPVTDRKTGNHLWARTNRFYEGLYFRKPMILIDGTADASRALTLGSISLNISPGNPSETAAYLAHSLTHTRVERMRDEISKVRRSECTLSTEYQQLKEWIVMRD